MQTYIEILLERQGSIARQLQKEQAMELPQYFAGGQALQEQEDALQAAGSEKRSSTQTPSSVPSAAERAGESGAQQALSYLMRLQLAKERSYQTRQAQSLTLQQTRQTGASVRQGGGGLAQTEFTGITENTVMMTGGIAARPTERSMQEISRFFERDARRYG